MLHFSKRNILNKSFALLLALLPLLRYYKIFMGGNLGNVCVIAICIYVICSNKKIKIYHKEKNIYIFLVLTITNFFIGYISSQSGVGVCVYYMLIFFFVVICWNGDDNKIYFQVLRVVTVVTILATIFVIFQYYIYVTLHKIRIRSLNSVIRYGKIY